MPTTVGTNLSEKALKQQIQKCKLFGNVGSFTNVTITSWKKIHKELSQNVEKIYIHATGEHYIFI